MLANKHIILGVTGGVAAYKSADLVRRLKDAGALVRVVMTKQAKEFITPLTFQAVSGNPVHDDLFDLKAEAAMGHIELARWADVVLVAPATADFIAKMAHGEANDLLTTLCLATQAPVTIAPAMNQVMWENTQTKANIKNLKEKKINILGPGKGLQACGDEGFGRMLEPQELVGLLEKIFETDLLNQKKIVITAGPTHEAIDPVRYISNKSSGKMGYSMAEAALEAGANVTLISGPVNLSPPAKAHYISVISAQEMHDAVMSQIANCDIFIGVAAVSDYQCQTISHHKIIKSNENLTITLKPTPDILSEVSRLKERPYVIGFAAQTEDLLVKAKQKLVNKKLDMIIANEVGYQKGMGEDENAVTVLWKNNKREFAIMPKLKLARELIALIAGEIKNGRNH